MSAATNVLSRRRFPASTGFGVVALTRAATGGGPARPVWAGGAGGVRNGSACRPHAPLRP